VTVKARPHFGAVAADESETRNSKASDQQREGREGSPPSPLPQVHRVHDSQLLVRRGGHYFFPSAMRTIM
jgi:hypothetical protein